MSSQSQLDLRLNGKTALVCGASAGIGEAAATALASQGAHIIALSRTESRLRELVSRLPGSGHRALAVDVGDHAVLRTRVTEEIAKSGGAIEILINNSAGPKGGPIADAKPEEFMAAFSQHLLGNQILAQTLLPGMKTRGYGRIVNVISTSVKIPIPGLGVSNTIRAAVASWAKTLSLEVAASGVTVNSVLPGYTKTQRLASLLQAAADKAGKTVEQISEDWKATIPARRFAEPEEVAAAIAFLVSPAAAYINGVVIPVDGGRTGSI